MTNTNKRCGTCRYFELFGIAHYGGQDGLCDWVSRHLVDYRIPFWVRDKTHRPQVNEYCAHCDAWEPPK